MQEHGRLQRIIPNPNLSPNPDPDPRQEYGRLQRIIRELHRSCQNDDGSDDLKKGTQLLEVRVRVRARVRARVRV